MSYGRYRELALLGRGGMARVLLATLSGAAGVQKLLVIKEILPELAHDPEMVTMFTDEARIATRLEHPNLIQTFELSQENGRYFFVMEFLDGRSYGALMGRMKGEVPLPIHLHVLTRVLDGLHAAHELTDLSGAPLSIVHRDVSPQNVFLCYGGAIKLVDFGIAKSASAESRTRTGVFKGKLSYAAPEQIENLTIDRRADIFAIGVMLWEALAKKRITKDLSEAALLQRRVSGTETPVRAECPDAPAELVAICERAMSKLPEGRYSTAAEMRAEIERFIETNKMRISDADVGALVAEKFAAERAELRRLVQERLTAPADAKSNEEPAPLPAAVVSGSSLRSWTDGDKPTIVSTTMEPKTVIESRKGGSFYAVLGVALVALVIAVISGALVLRSRGASTSTTGASSGITAVTAPSSAPASAVASASAAASASTDSVAKVQISISASPREARFSIDGDAIEGNPALIARPRDSAAHTLRVVADGFQTEERPLRLDRDVTLELALRPAPHTNDVRPQTNGTGGGKRPQKGIDTSDPWSTK
jgi:serine/threonine-protein kinase